MKQAEILSIHLESFIKFKRDEGNKHSQSKKKQEQEKMEEESMEEEEDLRELIQEKMDEEI